VVWRGVRKGVLVSKIKAQRGEVGFLHIAGSHYRWEEHAFESERRSVRFAWVTSGGKDSIALYHPMNSSEVLSGWRKYLYFATDAFWILIEGHHCSPIHSDPGGFCRRGCVESLRKASLDTSVSIERSFLP